MIKLDAHKSVHFCDGLSRRDFLHAGRWGWQGSGCRLSDLFALKAHGAVNPANDVNCICLFLVGAPSQLDTWDMKPDAPCGNPRAVQADHDQRARHTDQRDLPAHGASTPTSSRCVRSVHYTRRRRARRRASGDADRPAVPGRHRIPRTSGRILGYLKGPKGDIPPHVLLPRPIGNTGGNMPHGQTRGFWASSTTRSCSAPTRRIPPSRCPTCCRRTT